MCTHSSRPSSGHTATSQTSATNCWHAIHCFTPWRCPCLPWTCEPAWSIMYCQACRNPKITNNNNNNNNNRQQLCCAALANCHTSRTTIRIVSQIAACAAITFGRLFVFVLCCLLFVRLFVFVFVCVLFRFVGLLFVRNTSDFQPSIRDTIRNLPKLKNVIICVIC